VPGLQGHVHCRVGKCVICLANDGQRTVSACTRAHAEEAEKHLRELEASAAARRAA
jgi:hypothetical protein